MAKQADIMTSVILTEDGLAKLENDPAIALLLKHERGSYFSCYTAVPNGQMLEMSLPWFPADPAPSDPTEIRIELSIPMHFVLFTVSNAPDKTLGFGRREKS